MLSRHLAISGAVALGWLAALPASAQDVGGSWSLSGKDRSGRFRGNAALTQAPDAKVEGTLTLEYVRWSWSSMSYRPTGQTGSARIRAEVRGQRVVGRRHTTTGLSDILGNLDSAQSFPISYAIAQKEDGTGLKSIGGRFDGNRGEDRLTNQRTSGPTPPPPTGPDRIELPARLLAVPGTPEAGRQTFNVVVSGSAATLSLTGPGRLLRDGTAIASSLELQPGTHRLQIEGSADGRVTVALRRGSTEAARATSESGLERLYAILMGYQGAEVDYLDGDITKAISNVVPRLSGYARIEDGKSFDQSKIDQGLADPANPRRVVIDWCVTSEDLFRYLNRGTLRGLVWGSHGFMEPFPGCPDAELNMFESRVWSAVAGAPETGDKKNFMRDWRRAIALSARTHGKLDFVLMHSCCTGGIGDFDGGYGSYADEVWHYISAETKARCEAVLGTPLPVARDLRYATYNALSESVGWIQTFDGPSYFGMADVSWTQLRNSIRSGQ
jgi:hypothetical protein